jgi:hypothetical protein
MDALAKAEPKWMSEPLDRTDRQNYLPPRPTFPPPTITRHISVSDPEIPAATTQDVGASTPLDVTFVCSDASTTVGDVTINKVAVTDGEIDKVLPDGMGAGDFSLTIIDPTDVYVYAYVLFNPSTLAITSRTVTYSNIVDVPESRVETETTGFLVYVLAEAFMDDAGLFQVTNRRVGDIGVELIYGAVNGQPALYAGEEIGWLDLVALFP